MFIHVHPESKYVSEYVEWYVAFKMFGMHSTDAQTGVNLSSRCRFGHSVLGLEQIGW